MLQPNNNCHPLARNNNCHPLARPEDLFEFFQFRRAGQVVEGAPLCGLTLKAAGSMRFRWNETNPNREKVLQMIGTVVEPVETTADIDSYAGFDTLASRALNQRIIPVQLDHTHIVCLFFFMNQRLEFLE